jgi:hypothetical protein
MWKEMSFLNGGQVEGLINNYVECNSNMRKVKEKYVTISWMKSKWWELWFVKFNGKFQSLLFMKAHYGVIIFA